MEYTLLDFMAAGSSVAKLHFDLAIVALMKRREAHPSSIGRAQVDARDRAKQVRIRVFKHAFKELRMWRKR